jgi:hypothetical protein
MIAGRRIVHSGGDRGWPGDVPRFRRHISRLQALGWPAIRSKRFVTRSSAFWPTAFDSG